MALREVHLLNKTWGWTVQFFNSLLSVAFGHRFHEWIKIQFHKDLLCFLPGQWMQTACHLGVVPGGKAEEVCSGTAFLFAAASPPNWPAKAK